MSYDFTPMEGEPIHKDCVYEKEKFPEDLKEKDIELNAAPATRLHMLDFLAAIIWRTCWRTPITFTRPTSCGAPRSILASGFKPNVAEFMRIQRGSVASWIRGGQASGEISRDIDPERMAEQYYGGLIGINNQWLVSPDFDLAAAYEDFKRNLVRLLSKPQRTS